MFGSDRQPERRDVEEEAIDVASSVRLQGKAIRVPVAMSVGKEPTAWPLHFPDLPFTGANDRRGNLIWQLTDWFSSRIGWSVLNEDMRVTDRIVTTLDFESLRQHCPSADLFAALEMQPEEALACLCAAAYEVYFVVRPPGASHASALHNLAPGRVVVRLANHVDSWIGIRDLKATALNRIVTVRATVITTGGINPKVVAMEFVCGKCGYVVKQRFLDGNFAAPTRCPADGCRSRTFAPKYSDAEAIDHQFVQLQEVQDYEDGETRDASTIECELTEELVGACRNGDVVTLCGIARTGSGPAADRHGAKQRFRGSCVSAMYLVAVSVSREEDPAAPLTAHGGGRGAGVACGDGGDGVDTTDALSADYDAIGRLYGGVNGDAFPCFVRALCPAIYGHELLKAGLVLSLFGGVQKNVAGKGKVPLRGDAHVLVVGDPGMGKSQVLQAVSQAAPRGIYVTGNISTSVGLTASVGNAGGSGGFCLEAGAVVMADQGVCCIDEFDKMSAGSDYQGLLEVMEQQEVSVAKAGMVASLPAKTTIVAAANPTKGHYDAGTTLAENIKLSPALLSRFDLIFLLLDQPDREFDSVLSEHVMKLHAGREGVGVPHFKAIRYKSQPKMLQGPHADAARGEARRPKLVDRIRSASEADDVAADVSLDLVRKCVAYARRYVFPCISSQARQALKAFYLELRNHHAKCTGGIPITVRQLESMIRLAEARARVDMRETVTLEDAEDVIEIMRESLYSTIIDEYGVVTKGRGKGAGRRGKSQEAKRFLATLSQVSRNQAKREFSVAEMCALADEILLQVDDMKALIEQLNDAGELLKKGNGVYALA